MSRVNFTRNCPHPAPLSPHRTLNIRKRMEWLHVKWCASCMVHCTRAPHPTLSHCSAVALHSTQHCTALLHPTSLCFTPATPHHCTPTRSTPHHCTATRSTPPHSAIALLHRTGALHSHTPLHTAGQGAGKLSKWCQHHLRTVEHNVLFLISIFDYAKHL